MHKPEKDVRCPFYHFLGVSQSQTGQLLSPSNPLVSTLRSLGHSFCYVGVKDLNSGFCGCLASVLTSSVFFLVPCRVHSRSQLSSFSLKKLRIRCNRYVLEIVLTAEGKKEVFLKDLISGCRQHFFYLCKQGWFKSPRTLIGIMWINYSYIFSESHFPHKYCLCFSPCLPKYILRRILV